MCLIGYGAEAIKVVTDGNKLYLRTEREIKKGRSGEKFGKFDIVMEITGRSAAL